MERVFKLDTLEDTCIPEVFKEGTWTKLLTPSGNVHSKIIKEFFSNASVDGDHINYWVRHKEFVITRETIQEFLEVVLLLSRLPCNTMIVWNLLRKW